NWEQSSYDVEITQGGQTTSHSATSSDSILVEWPGEPLGAAERAKVRARAHGGDVSTPWSDWVAVETGLLKGEDWAGAVPISADRETEKGKPKRPVYFRREFPLE